MKPTPLDGVRILDLTHAWQGPICTMFLAAMGAEVIKIEPPWGDLERFHGRLIQPGKYAASFTFLNRGKKGIILNLKKEKGLEIFKNLVKLSDVLVENFSPGTMDSLGLGYETLKKINPKIIFASASGFGQYGPWSERLSFNNIAEAASGWSFILQEDAEHPPVSTTEPIADTIPGLFLLIGIISALHYRDKTGMAQRVDVSQADAMLGVLNSFTMYQILGIAGREAWRGPMSLGRGMLGGTIKAKDGWVTISAAGSGRIFDRFAAAIGDPLVDESAQKKVREWVANKTREEVVQILVKAEVPVASIDNLDEVAVNPQFKAREMLVEINHPLVGKLKTTGFPIKFSETLGKIDKPEPLLGQHTEEILVSLLGYNMEEIVALKNEGVI